MAEVARPIGKIKALSDLGMIGTLCILFRVNRSTADGLRSI